MTIAIICIVVFWVLVLALPVAALANVLYTVAHDRYTQSRLYAKTHNLPEPSFDYTFDGKYELQEDGIHYAPTRKKVS